MTTTPTTSASRGLRATAPGKLVLLGEYAVLRGHEAVVAAVDVRATATLSSSATLEVAFDDGGLLRACLDELGDAAPVSGRLVVDSHAFLDEGARKLGLGSSAAACVAALGVLRPDVDRATLHSLAQRAHRRFQRGRGSGIDVAASCCGGLVRFLRRGDDVVASPAPPLPTGLRIVPVWTGRSQDTRDFVAAVLARPDVDELTAPLGAAAAGFIDACARGDAADVLVAVAAAAHGMQRLGERAGIDVVSAPHARLATIAAAHGGSAKPSGAGGGDVGLAFVPRDGEPALRAAIAAAGLKPLALRLGDGVAGVTSSFDDDSTGGRR